MTNEDKLPAGVVQTRWVELVVALALVVIGLVVVVDSHRVGIEWESDGPKAGYFPNFIGWILAAVGALTAVKTLYRWKKLAANVFVQREELKPVLYMLAPTVVYIALVALLGIYFASFLFIAGFMKVQGKYGWVPTLAVSLGVPGAIFLLFEIWFLVPLPKGPIEQLLGY
jgi:uncharacterized membrane protein YphA (DoxX/SURF4 family)